MASSYYEIKIKMKKKSYKIIYKAKDGEILLEYSFFLPALEMSERICLACNSGVELQILFGSPSTVRRID